MSTDPTGKRPLAAARAVTRAARQAHTTLPARFTEVHKRAMAPEARKEIARLDGTDNWHSILYIALDWSVAGASAAVCWIMGFNPAIYLVALLVIGSRQRALMNLVHQASHGLLFKNRLANSVLGNLLVALPLLNTVSSYASEHVLHHGHLWDERKDPKTRRYRALGLINPSASGHFARRHVVKPLLLFHVPFNVWGAIWRNGDRVQQTLLRILFWAAALAGVAVLGITRDFLLLWVVPYVTSFQIIRYFGEMAEHSGLQTSDPWYATRAWTSSWLVRSLLAPHADHLHLTHHLFPRIPHYRIKAAHALLLAVPEYARGHHCDGFFLPRGSGPSVIDDIMNPAKCLSRTMRLEGSKAS